MRQRQGSLVQLILVVLPKWERESQDAGKEKKKEGQKVGTQRKGKIDPRRGKERDRKGPKRVLSPSKFKK